MEVTGGLLGAPGLIENLRYTCYPSVKDELPDALEDPVVEDGSVITSRGPGTATEFSLQIIRALIDDATAGKVAESICYYK